MPADVLALVLAACTVPALHRAAATNMLMHEAGTERRRKIAVLKQCPFHMTCHDVLMLELNRHQVDDNMMIKLSGALVSGALPLLKKLMLSGNQIGNAGVESLASACAGGALASVIRLSLNANKVGDEGMIKFSEALGSGAMAQLKVSWRPLLCPHALRLGMRVLQA